MFIRNTTFCFRWCWIFLMLFFLLIYLFLYLNFINIIMKIWFAYTLNFNLIVLSFFFQYLLQNRIFKNDFVFLNIENHYAVRNTIKTLQPLFFRIFSFHEFSEHKIFVEIKIWKGLVHQHEKRSNYWTHFHLKQ